MGENKKVYALKPFGVYLLDSLRQNQDAMVRVRRMLAGLDIPMGQANIFGRDGVVDVARELSTWSPQESSDVIPVQHRRAIVFTKSREVWEKLEEELGQKPDSFVCGCNPIEGPGPRMMPSQHLSHSAYYPTENHTETED
ncbi:MAG: hypothetical protein ACLFWL_03620 [Candidatus Brocadiia bacterium]